MLKRCKIIFVSTTEKTNIFLNDRGHLIYNELLHMYDHKEYRPQHIYILSNEIPKDGDWKYNFRLNCVWQHNREGKNLPNELKYHQNADTYKIIATTDSSLSEKLPMEGTGTTYVFPLPKIPFAFITEFLLEQNKGNVITDVNVEYTPKLQKIATGETVIGSEADYNLEIKLNKDYEINVSQLDKSSFKLTKEEIQALLDQIDFLGFKFEFELESKDKYMIRIVCHMPNNDDRNNKEMAGEMTSFHQIFKEGHKLKFPQEVSIEVAKNHSVSEIEFCRAVFGAIMEKMSHEAAEIFLFGGKHLFNEHHYISDGRRLSIIKSVIDFKE